MSKTFNATRRLAALAGPVMLAGLSVGHPSVSGEAAGDELERGFKSPPDSAKPRVWWHWMNGNITK